MKLRIVTLAALAAGVWCSAAQAQNTSGGTGTLAGGTVNSTYAIIPPGGGGSIDWSFTGITATGATVTLKWSDDGVNYYTSQVVPVSTNGAPGNAETTVTADGVVAQPIFRHARMEAVVTTAGSAGVISVSYIVSASSQDPVTASGSGPTANVAVTNAPTVEQGSPPWLIKPGALGIVPLDISVTGSPGAVTVLNAGHATAGGNLVTANAAGMCVDEHTTAGTVTGTPSSTICVVQNQAVALTPTSGAVSVNSTGSAVSIGGTGWQ